MNKHGAGLWSASNGDDGQQEVRLLRLRDVLEIIPISKSGWFAGIKLGRYPQGRQLGSRVTVWRSDEIQALVRAV
jgi:prophage regulatory protein